MHICDISGLDASHHRLGTEIFERFLADRLKIIEFVRKAYICTRFFIPLMFQARQSRNNLQPQSQTTHSHLRASPEYAK